jgi:Domain of unknown function (DUF4304)
MNDLIFKNLLTATGRRLAPYGFKKKGAVFRLISGENAALIAFQRSQNNRRETLSFTVNIAIACGLLFDPDGLTAHTARAYDGHLQTRIGTLLPDRQDLWWDIDSGSDENALIAEVTDLICNRAVPYLLRYVDTYELLALWDSGQAPGLTEGARVKKLEALKNSLETRGGSAPVMT